MRKALRRDWLCRDERERGGCSHPEGEQGACPDCPVRRLDAEMAGPLGDLICRGGDLNRAMAAGFTLGLDLPADEVLVVEILQEERLAYESECRQEAEEAATVKRELQKRG